MRKKLSIKDMTYIAFFAAATAILSQISIPTPGYMPPFTLQTFSVSLAGLILGAKNGTLSAIVYVLLGAVGLPVFAGLSGGIGVIAGHTGGFIMSFPIMAWFAGIVSSKSKPIMMIGIAAGAAVNFAVGMFWLGHVLNINLQMAFTAAVIPFLPLTLIDIFALPFVSKALKSVLVRGDIKIL